jgi:tetratricopeptide (TPR) repeat protein
MPKNLPPQFLRSKSKRGAAALFSALILAGASANAIAQTKPIDFEKKLDDIAQKIELLDKVRAAETKALEDRIDVKKDLAEVKGAIATNALAVADVKKDVVNNAQQTVNWWLAWLAAFLAVFGIGVPLVLTRDLRAKHKAQIEEIVHIRERIDAAHSAAQTAASNIDALHESAQVAKKEIDDAVATIRTAPTSLSSSDTNVTPTERATVATAAAMVAESKEAALADRLFARGVQTFNAGNYSAAAAHFAAVVAERSGDHVALTNWGFALGRLADAADGEEQRRLRLEAISKYEAALKIKPDMHLALNNWGIALNQLANAADGEEQRRLLLEAISKYEAALKIKPDMHLALNNWGIALVHLAHRSESDDERGELLTQAEAVLQRHAVIVGHASYNLACVAAMRRDVGRFVEIADGLPDVELPDAKHLREDKDLHGIRETPEFQAWWTRKFGHEPLVKPVA